MRWRPVVAALSLALAAGLAATGSAPPPLPAAPRTDAQLDATKDRLDALALQRGAPSAVTSWWVDAATRTVVVALHAAPRDARSQAFVRDARDLGPEVRVTTDAPGPATPRFDLVGGDAILIGDARCSVGFSVRTLAGAPRMLTAGHCTQSGGDVRGANNEVIGPIRSSVFSREGDWGVVEVGPAWTTTPQVAVGGPATLRVTGEASVGVGAPVCRSGSTTGHRCGVVTAVDVTANYPQGPVTGLTATSACSEGGDSGGSFVSGTSAVGLLSGGTGDCRESGGSSLFQPLAPVLAREGLQVVTG